MTSQARIEANRANAQKSTGPKTDAGKARSALNALVHGFRSRIVLERASPQAAATYSPFLDSLVTLLQPVGPLESQCVETMALASWRKRLVIAKELDIEEEPDPSFPKFVDRTIFDIPRIPPPPPPPVPKLFLPCPEKLLPLLRYEAHLTREYRIAYRHLRDLQALRLGGDHAAPPDLPDLPSPPPSAPAGPVPPASVPPTSPPPAGPLSSPPSLDPFSAVPSAGSSTSPVSVPNEPNLVPGAHLAPSAFAPALPNPPHLKDPSGAFLIGPPSAAVDLRIPAEAGPIPLHLALDSRRSSLDTHTSLITLASSLRGSGGACPVAAFHLDMGLFPAFAAVPVLLFPPVPNEPNLRPPGPFITGVPYPVDHLRLIVPRQGTW